MAPQQQIDRLLALLASLYKDAQMAIDGEWDRSIEGFEDQQYNIDTTIRGTNLRDQFNIFLKQ